MEENKNCYFFKKINYEEGLFDEAVDVTYIIHLTNNGRIEHINNQLREFKPTKMIYIVFNEGYKKCKKSDFIKISSDDLIDVNLQIIKHSNKMNFKNILILEDDFIFNEEIKKSFHKNNLINFWKKKMNEPFYYLLGCTPMFILPYDYYNYIPILLGGCHAVVYSKKMQEKILLEDQSKMTDWDGFNKTLNHKYMYYMPLCYQLFPETENSKVWGIKFNFIIYYLTQFMFILYKILNMDKNVEPGYFIFYTFSKLLLFFIIVLFFFILYKFNIFSISKKYGKKNNFF
jgi:hypothetical protein